MWWRSSTHSRVLFCLLIDGWKLHWNACRATRECLSNAAWRVWRTDFWGWYGENRSMNQKEKNIYWSSFFPWFLFIQHVIMSHVTNRQVGRVSIWHAMHHSHSIQAQELVTLSVLIPCLAESLIHIDMISSIGYLTAFPSSLRSCSSFLGPFTAFEIETFIKNIHIGILSLVFLCTLVSPWCMEEYTSGGVIADLK